MPATTLLCLRSVRVEKEKERERDRKRKRGGEVAGACETVSERREHDGEKKDEELLRAARREEDLARWD